ncbi:MAG: hypothetical protein E7012_03825 [Alphaproteobacteria bacterium]|nr:hypothetical protein [Alphaproteobacteria bacterium]
MIAIIIFLLALVICSFLMLIKVSTAHSRAQRIIKLRDCDIACLKTKVLELEKENERLELCYKQLVSANNTGYQGH